MAYYVSLKQFEGPLDLLLHLISKAKVDIKDIFVSEITEQYLASMQDIDELDMDSASEFLTMAATLLEIKSRALLPRPPKDEEDGEETPEQALIRRLEDKVVLLLRPASMKKMVLVEKYILIFRDTAMCMAYRLNMILKLISILLYIKMQKEDTFMALQKQNMFP